MPFENLDVVDAGLSGVFVNSKDRITTIAQIAHRDGELGIGRSWPFPE